MSDADDAVEQLRAARDTGGAVATVAHLDLALTIAALDAARAEMRRAEDDYARVCIALEEEQTRAERLEAERDQARRAALEEAIGACGRVRGVHMCDRVVILAALRALLDAPAPVKPDTST